MLKLKSALFGYKKTDVCDYIDNLANDISKKYEDEIKRLTEENDALKKQLEERKAGVDEVAVVSGIIIEAQRFAEGLKSKAIAENEELKRKNELAAKQVAERIKSCDDGLAQLRNNIYRVLTDTDGELNKLGQDLTTLSEQTSI